MMSDSYKDIEIRISEAYNAYFEREKPKIKPLSREFNVPYERLLSRIKGRNSRSTRTITNKALDEAQEQAIIQWIASPTPSMIEQCANQILSRSGGGTVGKSWVYRFIKRLPPHLNLKPKKWKIKESKRIQAEDIGSIQNFYNWLEILVKQYNILPKNIYNFDESNFNLGEGKNENVVTAAPGAAAYIGTGDRGESVTIIETVTADGWVMSPFFILRGTWQLENWYQHASLPDDYRIAGGCALARVVRWCRDRDKQTDSGGKLL